MRRALGESHVDTEAMRSGGGGRRRCEHIGVKRDEVAAAETEVGNFIT